ncbi:N-acetylglucosamine kinase-like BadF-type ATPase [Paenibacillus shirakamiensis]|uniref:N-acetylglucosamine kinase-like BadF-type ATPase n=1 Tax=Paenibacillus shirakamiensis TaxID=1265935 RepID=A0ABS4JE85_9BACL|nr:BadF/BadG/BcrA/BcrD ATPase family protein [Paenibacillus shirakamiensis]MBP1999375.1 N-acetylglucosamine kinase-like BadF-type ATPase [Paenibacillus shirakamiensis]
MKYYLGVDAGGSKTNTLIVNSEGHIVGQGRSGNGNHQEGYEQAKANLQSSVQQALEEAKLTTREINYAYFGLAGADREPDYKILRPMIAEFGFHKYDLNCDTIIALRAGTRQTYGVVLICGTGTNSAGRNEQGEFYQCGGFSYMLGDYGGGADLSIAAFRSVIRAWDGRGRATLLTSYMLEDLGYQTVDEMFEDYLDHQKTPPLHIAKLVFKAAEEGDDISREILHEQGKELGRSARAVIERLHMQTDTFDVVLAGSIVTRGKGSYILDELRKALLEYPGATLVKLSMEPVIGAVWLAMEADDVTIQPVLYDRLEHFVFEAEAVEANNVWI